MNKVILSIIGLFLQTGLLYAQSTDDERFANWTEEQYQHYEDSVRTVLYPPVFACKADDSAVKISQRKLLQRLVPIRALIHTYLLIDTSVLQRKQDRLKSSQERLRQVVKHTRFLSR